MDLLRVLLVDEHRMLTEALAIRLSAVPDLWVLGQYSTDDPRLTEVVSHLGPDVVVIDVAPVGPAAPGLLARLTAACPGTRLVVLTASRDPHDAVAAARIGVDAWVRKDCSVEQLVSILRGVALGHASYPPELLGMVLHELREDVRRARDRSEPLDSLTDRERDVLAGLMEGLRGQELADNLGLSTNTVRTHMNNMFGKLGVHSRLEAVRVARDAAARRPGGRTVY